MCQIPFFTLQRKTPGLSRTGGRAEESDCVSSVVSAAASFSQLLDLFTQRVNEISHSLAPTVYHETYVPVKRRLEVSQQTPELYHVWEVHRFLAGFAS